MIEKYDLFLSLDASTKKNLEIKCTNQHGRFLVATKDIRAGDLIFEEISTSWAPMLQTKPVCLSCVQQVDGEYRCEACHWPMCNQTCAQHPTHKKQECSVLSTVGKRVPLEDLVYDAISVLRTILLTGEKKTVYDSMQDHFQEWTNNVEFMEKFEPVVEFIQSTLNLDIPRTKILRVFAVLFTNDFSHTKQTGNQVRCMFPLTALLNHSCFPNITRMTVENDEGGIKMIVKASRTILKGEEIYNSYTDVLQPAFLRRKILLETKLMDCSCSRCRDNLDMGLHGNSIVCPFCKQANCNPSSVESWMCTSCHKTVPTSKVEEMLSWIAEKQTKLLGSSHKSKADKMEAFISEYSKKLGSKNMLIVRVKYNLIGIYGAQKGQSDQDVPEKIWRRKIQLCEEILEILKVLEPGLTLRKGRLLYQLYIPLAMVAQKQMEKKHDLVATRKLFQRSLVTLNLVIQIFGDEDPQSWEYRTAENSRDNVHQLKQIIKQLK